MKHLFFFEIKDEFLLPIETIKEYAYSFCADSQDFHGWEDNCKVEVAFIGNDGQNNIYHVNVYGGMGDGWEEE
jgi:hypothetical protein